MDKLAILAPFLLEISPNNYLWLKYELRFLHLCLPTLKLHTTANTDLNRKLIEKDHHNERF